MRGSFRGGLVLAAIASLAISSTGQVADSQTDSTKREELRYIPRLPSTSTFRVTQVDAGTDGDAVTRESTEVLVYSRRWQMHSTSTLAEGGDTLETRVAVLDREARTISRWTVPGRQVTVTDLPAQGSGVRLCAASLLLDDPPKLPEWMSKPHPSLKPVHQSLGTQTILGIEARGSRTTFTTPTGAVGNTEAIVWTQEVWLATQPGLVLVVRAITDYPWSGKTTREPVDLDLNEPNPSVFQPPTGYAIVKKDAAACPAPHAAPAAEPEQ
jgi:hypothetical protein